MHCKHFRVTTLVFCWVLQNPSLSTHLLFLPLHLLFLPLQVHLIYRQPFISPCVSQIPLQRYLGGLTLFSLLLIAMVSERNAYKQA